MNQVVLIGNVGKDCIVRYTPNGHAVCNLSIATNKKIKDKFVPTWHKVVCWRELAEKCVEIKKGNRIVVIGELTYKVVEKEGVKTYFTEVLAWQIMATPSITQATGTSPAESHESNDLDEALYGQETGGM